MSFLILSFSRIFGVTLPTTIGCPVAPYTTIHLPVLETECSFKNFSKNVLAFLCNTLPPCMVISTRVPASSTWTWAKHLKFWSDLWAWIDSDPYQTAFDLSTAMDERRIITLAVRNLLYPTKFSSLINPHIRAGVRIYLIMMKKVSIKFWIITQQLKHLKWFFFVVQYTYIYSW